MSKLRESKDTIVPSRNANEDEIRVLRPNDALILMTLAKLPSKSSVNRRKLLAILSDEGRLVARALTSTATKSSLPAGVISTANGLRRLAQDARSSHKDNSSKTRAKRAQTMSSGSSKRKSSEEVLSHA
jgi:hypothetical protein